MSPTDQGIYLDPMVATLLLAGLLLIALAMVVLVIIAVVNGALQHQNQRPPREKRTKTVRPKKATGKSAENFGEDDGVDTAETVARYMVMRHDNSQKDRPE